jgi:hypothetical protein
MAAMRMPISLLLFFLSGCAVVALGADEDELSRLVKARRIFDLRRALDQTTNAGEDARFYRALVEARFGQEERAVENLRAVLAANPGDEMALRAHDELSDAFTRLGRYAEAATEFEHVLRLLPANAPERGSADNSRTIFAALKNVGPQTVEFGPEMPLRAKPNKLGLWSLPIEVNGKQAEWVLDTGMTFSTVTESEAKRLGLQRLDSGGQGSSGHNGKELPVGLAVASDLGIGAAHLRSVVVVVVADNSLNLGSARLHGIVGLPAIRAFSSIAVSANGDIRIHSISPEPQREPNMFFDGLTLSVEVHHAGHAVSMILDTGGTTTYLYPTVREALTPEQRAKLSPQSRRFGGIGGSTKIETELVPQLELELPGRTVGLGGVALRKDSNPYSDGLLGMDALKDGFAIDFRDMRFEVN